MKIKKSYLLAALVLCLFIGIGLFIYKRYLLSSIVIVDNNQYFNLTYAKGSGLEKTLKEMGAWEKSHVTVDGISFFTLSRVVIKLVDTVEPRYQNKDSEGYVLLSNNVERHNNELIIRIYLNPKLKKSRTNEALNNPVLASVLDALNSTIGTEPITGQEVARKARIQLEKLRNEKVFQVSDN